MQRRSMQDAQNIDNAKEVYAGRIDLRDDFVD
jgi:hypothetical protein